METHTVLLSAVLSGILMSTSALGRVKGMEKMMGDWGAGGGNALVCFDNEASVTQTKENAGIIPDNVLSDINRIEMYDLFEAKMNRGLSQESPEIVEIKNNEEIYSYIDEMGRRFESRVNYLDNLIQEATKILPKARIRYTSFGIDQQNDIANVILPSGRCLITTMAAQINVGDHYKLIIDQRLYNHTKHSYQSKATLILHEVIYAHFRKHFGHENSAAVREIVSSLITYHHDITESSVAQQLADLKVVKDDYQIINFHQVKNYSLINERLKPYVLSSNYHWFTEILYGLINHDLIPLASKVEDTDEFINFFYEILGRAQSEGLSLSSTKPTVGNLNQIFVDIFAVTKDHEAWHKQLDKYEELTKTTRAEATTILDQFPADVRKRVNEGHYGGWLTGSSPDQYPDLFFHAATAVKWHLNAGSFWNLYHLIGSDDFMDSALIKLFAEQWWIDLGDGQVLGTMDFNKPVPRRVKAQGSENE